jgi:hypothetical protein
MMSWAAWLLLCVYHGVRGCVCVRRWPWQEESEDAACKQQYGAAWTRTSSASLNAALHSDLQRYGNLLPTAAASDL